MAPSGRVTGARQATGTRQADGARRAAVAALVKMHGGGWSNLSVKSVFASSALSPRDRAFAGALFYTTAERVVTLDYLLGPLLKKPVDKLDVEVRAILETGLCQPRYMQVPARAAVDEAVKLARSFGKSSAAGLVNAVLRKAAALPPPAGPYESEEQRVCVEYSLSGPVAQAVMAALPGAYEAFLQASFAPPHLAVRLNPFKTSEEQLLGAFTERGQRAKAGRLPGCLYLDAPGDLAGDTLFREGCFTVQGEASQYAVACLDPQKGEQVLDLCAAPGGKTAGIAFWMGDNKVPGRGILSCDVHPGRVELIRKNMERLGLAGVEVRQNDAAESAPAPGGFDRVLCDAPCSGLGVLGKKPDLRYGAGEGFSSLPPLQLAILCNAAASVKKGGRLVYSTCTIRPEENEGVVRAFLEQNPGFRPIDPPFAPEGADIRDKMMTILPQNTGMDGFFVATLESLC